MITKFKGAPRDTECPCCHGAGRLTVVEHDDAAGRTFITKPICTHCMGAGVVDADTRESSHDM
jgi:DnaJ-class molecular chaperone